MYDELYYGSWLARYFCDAVCPGRNCLGACVCYATARYRMTAKHTRWCETFERWLRKQPAVGGVAFLAGGALSLRRGRPLAEGRRPGHSPSMRRPWARATPRFAQ